jgi:hypothetical protein
MSTMKIDKINIILTFLILILTCSCGWKKHKQINGFLDNRIEIQYKYSILSAPNLLETRLIDKEKSTLFNIRLIKEPNDILSVMSINERTINSVSKRQKLGLEIIPYLNGFYNSDYRILSDTSLIAGYRDTTNLRKIMNDNLSKSDTIKIILWTKLFGNLYSVKFGFDKSTLTQIQIDTLLTNIGDYYSIE